MALAPASKQISILGWIRPDVPNEGTVLVMKSGAQTRANEQWLWLSWWSGCFKHQWSEVQIQLSWKFYLEHLGVYFWEPLIRRK